MHGGAYETSQCCMNVEDLKPSGGRKKSSDMKAL